MNKNGIEPIANKAGDSKRSIFYFTMEIALRSDMPTYSGGLGVLAGDTLKSAADLGIPMAGVTMLWRNGYFKQEIDENGWQKEENAIWDYKNKLRKLPNYARVKIGGESIRIEVWEYKIVGRTGYSVPVYFLDTNLPENPEHARNLNQYLYGGDEYTRLCQEVVLGIGGIRILRDIGFNNGQVYHLNEGHASLLALELIRERGYNSYDKIKKNCVFTTHTPVAAGHDEFPYDLLKQVLHPIYLEHLEGIIGHGHSLNLTRLSHKLSRYVNGVSQMHGKVAREMLDDPNIGAITNGIHLQTWIHESFQDLFTDKLPGWQFDPSVFVHALKIPDDEIRKAHNTAKAELLDYVNQTYKTELKEDVLTVGFARRAATYKRADLLFTDIERLLEIGAGKIQFIYAGKAHPKDNAGKELIQRVVQGGKKLGKEIPVVYLEEYNMDIGAMLTSGCDVWLNNPQRPREASGTSGMKAASNGVLNFSILDGWWIEGHLEDKTGWAIGPRADMTDMEKYDESKDVEDLYRKLEEKVIPTYYEKPEKWVEMMKTSIALITPYFNTHRMLREYVEYGYSDSF
ncbi:MAG: alpha-glucan family phosphorylase [Candidatus Marinimicrobia bacterium]|nr:alpha-glucan family phosphorylase [Candidatus Neomarinimicrobiota bacterium]MCF7829465.1 alpha-glucan family phosphorylase [Candidatus Neomarinimicrobiota bacterium]MCF7882344.1 alpha-glucan family phosphorylase [Candidatus Neomarinimicrobiota bacterium]